MNKAVLCVVVILLAITLGSTFSSAQITITNSNVTSNFVGYRWYSVHDTLSNSWNLGSSSSSPQTFDFSGITIAPETAITDSIDYMTPAGHSHASDFPTATACTQTVVTDTNSGYTITQTMLEYFEVTSSGTYILGVAERQQVTPPPPPPFPADTTGLILPQPKSLVLPLPLTLGTSTSGIDTTVFPNGITEINSHTFTADAFGTLTIPGGHSVQCIRLLIDHVKLSTESGVTTRTRNLSVNFWGSDMTEMSFDVDTLYAGGSIVPDNYTVQYRGALTGVKNASPFMPSAFHLYQNYPNPFNPSTTIDFAVARSGNVTLKVYDLLGQEIATLVDRDLAPGSYSVPWNADGLPSGVYYYRLESGAFSGVRKLMLTR